MDHTKIGDALAELGKRQLEFDSLADSQQPLNPSSSTALSEQETQIEEVPAEQPDLIIESQREQSVPREVAPNEIEKNNESPLGNFQGTDATEKYRQEKMQQAIKNYAQKNGMTDSAVTLEMVKDSHKLSSCKKVFRLVLINPWSIVLCPESQSPRVPDTCEKHLNFCSRLSIQSV